MRRYKKIDTYRTKEGIRYTTNSIYPDIPETEDDIYIIASSADRYDKLALQYYNDSSLWWIIASSNNHQRASLYPTPGAQIRIPASKEQAISLYNKINSSR
jgi:hypothetical protein